MKKTVLAVLLTLPLLFAAATTYAAGCCSDEACCTNCTDCKH